MSIFSRQVRVALATFSLVPMFASSIQAVGAAAPVFVASAYTSTSPLIVSYAWDAPVLDVVEAVVPVAPVVPEPAKTLKVDYIDITAYRPVFEECDSDPLVTADGTYIPAVVDKVNIVASNNMPFGTKFRIPDHFGDKVFEVRDRMNARYTKRVDILMTGTKKEVNQWGLKRQAKIEIIEMGTNAHKWNDPEMKIARKLGAK